MQSKAMEGLRKNTNPSNFVLQLPASYTQTDQELTGKLKLLTNKRSTITLLVINTAASFVPWILQGGGGILNEDKAQ